MDINAIYHMLRLEVLHPKLFTFARDGPLPLMWNNLTTRSQPLKQVDFEALEGRSALIAGATSGCGLELAKILAKHCSRLIITARNPKRGELAIEEIRRGLSDEMKVKAEIELWPLEMESFQSIQEFIGRLEGLESLDMAVLNAGVWHLDFALSQDSIETHLQVNYLASCAISLCLLKVLGRGRWGTNARPGRILNVSSEGHSLEDIPTHQSAKEALDSFNDPKALSCYQRYRFSKLLSMIWTHELALAIDSQALGVEIASFTPGASQTNICRDLGTGPVVSAVMNFFCRPAEEGAWTYVRALNAKDFHGRYFFRERHYEPTDCVTSDKHKQFRQDLVKETVATLANRVSIPPEIKEWLRI